MREQVKVLLGTVVEEYALLLLAAICECCTCVPVGCWWLVAPLESGELEGEKSRLAASCRGPCAGNLD